MYWIRFWALTLVSFITAIVATLFVPSAFWNRVLSVAYCTVFSVNSTFCTANFGQADERVIAANSIQQDVRMYYGEKKSNPKQLDKTDNTILAFKPDSEAYGHIPITKKALAQVTIGKLKFTKTAIDEIVVNNKAVDLEIGGFLGLETSEDFDIPQNHFDNELFQLGSQRLINLKKDIINILKAIKNEDDCDESNNSNDQKTKEEVKQKGMEARKFLGNALHTLQDFYAHSNWVELGFTNIDKRLGREIIPNPKPNTRTSPQVEKIEILDQLPRTIIVEDAGTLLPDFKNNSNPARLTSGYFKSLTSPCEAPPGKTRHGAAFLCPNGLNKDEPSRPGYMEAYNLAFRASIDFTNQIIQDPAISGNVAAIKALMGITKDEQKQCEKKPASTGNSFKTTIDLTKGILYSTNAIIPFLVADEEGRGRTVILYTSEKYKNKGITIHGMKPVPIANITTIFFRFVKLSNAKTPTTVDGFQLNLVVTSKVKLTWYNSKGGIMAEKTINNSGVVTIRDSGIGKVQVGTLTEQDDEKFRISNVSFTLSKK